MVVSCSDSGSPTRAAHHRPTGRGRWKSYRSTSAALTSMTKYSKDTARTQMSPWNTPNAGCLPVYAQQVRHRQSQPLNLDLMRWWYTYSDAYQRGDPDGAVSFALAQLVQKLLAKTTLFSSAAILTFLPLWCHFWPDLKMTWVKIVELVRPYSMPFTASL